jgi:hypothetical protein
MIRLLIAEVLNMLFQVLKGPGPLVGVSTYEVNIDSKTIKQFYTHKIRCFENVMVAQIHTDFHLS